MYDTYIDYCKYKYQEKTVVARITPDLPNSFYKCEESEMKDEELKAQINDIIEGEIQNGINDYLEAQEDKEDSGVGFVDDEAKELNVKVYQDQVDKLIKEYKQIKKFRKSNLGQVQKMGLVDKHGKPL